MCRLMAYVGQPQLLADIVLWPDRSIIKQSYDARERKIDPTLPFHLGHGNLNGDGFGIGWFSTEERRERDPTPCVFTSITPAWNNENLSRLACKIVSPLVFAHVRAAYPGMPVSEQNCHPFQFSRYMWMHNGVVAGFAQIRRSLLETLSDCAYNAVASFHSDSAVSFALFLNHLPDMRAQLAPDVLIKAMQDTISTISTVQRRHSITATSLLNFVVSDGTTLIATRFVSPETDGPASLYYAEGAGFARTPVVNAAAALTSPAPAPAGAPTAAGGSNGVQGGGEAGATPCGAAAAGSGSSFVPCSASANSGSSITQESSYELGVSAQGPAVVFVASEPITASASDWVAVPKNTALVVTREKGGFLNTLRCPLRGSPQQQQPLQYPVLTSPCGVLPSSGPPPWLVRSSSVGVGTSAVPWASGLPGQQQGQQHQQAYLDPQRDVCLCLEALSRGISAKSRAFLAHRSTGTGLGLNTLASVVLPPAGDTLQELPSAGMSNAGNPGFGRSSLGGQTGPLAEVAGSAPPPVAVPIGASRAESQGLDAPSADTHDYMRLVGHSGPVMAMTVCPYTSRLYTSSVDCSVRVWSLRDNSCLHTMIGQRKPVTAMRLRSQGRLLLASSGRKIRVWDAIGFRCLQLIKISDSCGTIRCLEVYGIHRHHDGGAAAAAGVKRADPAANGAAAGPQGDSSRSSLTGEGDGEDPLLRGPNARDRRSTDGGSSSMSLLEASLSMQDIILDGAADREVPSAASDGTASSAAGAHSVSQGLSLLFVGCQDTTVKVFTLDEHQLLAAAAAAAVAAAAVVTMTATAALSSAPTQNRLALSGGPGGEGNAAASRRPSASLLGSVKSNAGGMTTPPPSPFAPGRAGSALPSRTSVTGVSGPPALLPPRIITTPEEPEHGISDLAPLMVTAAEGGAHVGPVNCLALCGRYLCSGGGDATVRVWEAATLRLVGVLRGHRGSVLCLLGLGGSTLLSGARDNTIRVWDLEMDMMCRRTLTGHKDDVTGLTAQTLHRHGAGASAGRHPDWAGWATPLGRSAALASTIVASSSADGTVRLWSTTWSCLCILSLPISTAPSVPAALCGCLSADMAMAGYSDGEVRLWHVDDIHCAVLSACNSEAAAAAAAAASVLDAGQLLQAACGCLLNGVDAGAAGTGTLPYNDNGGGAGSRTAAVQAAISQVQQHGAAAAAAAAAVLTEPSPSPPQAPSCRRSNSRGGGGVQEALSLLTAAVAAEAAQTRAQAQPLDVPGPVAAAARQAAAAPAVQSAAGGPGATEVPEMVFRAPPAAPEGIPGSMVEAPSLLQYMAARQGRSASAIQMSTGGGADRNGEDTAEAPRQSDGGAAAGNQVATAAAQAPDQAGAGFWGSSGQLLLKGPSSASSSSANPLALPPPSVPIHIHGRKSPLPSPSLSNMAAALAAGAVPGQAGVVPCAQLPLPLPLGLGSHFCSTSDQQLEAALRDFVRIKTVSNSPKQRDDCHKGAKFLAKMLEGLGADVKVVQVYEDKNPVVIGRLGHSNDRPTVTFYGHYDVQPAAEPDWATNPFELNSVNEYLYGRGVSDNKGPILAFIFAVKELMNACGGDGAAGSGGGACGGAGARLGRLPVNVAFVFEGEEENGSRGFATAVTQNLRWFEGTQLIIISNTLWVGENVPCLTYGMRGMLSLTVQITGPERDLHSGNDGGVFSEPMVDLLRVMATLVGPGGRVQVPGFYDDVEPSLIDLAWTSLEGSEEFSLEGYKAALGVPSLTAPPNKRDLLVTRWCRPSLSVVDMRPGAGANASSQQQAEPASTCYRFGPTRFSVIPKAAQGKVSVRFVPNQDADRLVACLRRHVEESFTAIGSSNRIDLHVEARGNWWEVSHGSPWLSMAEAAIYKAWGVHPLYVREGGTMPVASYLERLLCAPAIMIPMGQSSDNCHLANERICRTNLFKGKNVIRRLLEEIAAMGLVPAPSTTAAAMGAGPGEGSFGLTMAGGAAVLGADEGADLGAPTACAGLAE